MPRTAPLLVSLLVLLAVATAGCRFGEARFESTISNSGFDPAGTVFSYLDEHDDALVAETNPRVAVAMTWIIFDPSSDLNDLEGSALADYSHELKLRDALSLIFAAQGDLTPGATFKSVVTGGEEQGDGKMTVHLHLAPERLSTDSTYAGFQPFASVRTTTVTLSAADFSASAPVLAGDVKIVLERGGTDPGDARQGTFTGSFKAPLVDERPAEQNLALLDVQAVLGLPLPARVQP